MSDASAAQNPDSLEDLFLKAVFEFEFFSAGPWYKDRELVAGIVTAVARLPLFAEFTLAGPEDRQKPFSGVEAATALMANGTDDVTYLQDGPDETRTAMVRIAPSDNSLTLKIWCGGAVLQRHRATLLDQLSQVIRDILGQFTGVAGLAYGYAFPVHDRANGFSYPRPRPPQRHASIQIYSVVEYFDLAFHRSTHAEAALDGVEALLSGEAPECARWLSVEGSDLVEVRFVEDAGDEAGLQRGASAHEVWLSTHLPTRIDGGYNALGDAVERVGGDETPAPPLTLYSASSGIGYKAVMVSPEGAIERDAWDEAAEVLAAGQISGDRPVGAVKLIVPARRHALQIAAEAGKAGFAAVLYPDDEGRFWNPDPPGRWIGSPKPD